MKNYIDGKGKVYSYEEDVPKKLLDEKISEFGLVAISDADLAILNAPTEAELLQAIEYAKPKVVTMRQARLALLQSDLLITIQDAITNGTNEALKIEWEYATEVNRDWQSLIDLAQSLNINDAQLDELFLLASTL